MTKGFGHHLRTTRKNNGLNGTDLAQRSGVSKSMISRLEHDLSDPTLETLIKLAQGLGISLTSFIAPFDYQLPIDVLPFEEYDA